MYFLLKHIQWEKILSYGNDIDEIIDIFYSTILNIFDKTVPMTKVDTNTSKYPKHIHSIQLKCLQNFKNMNNYKYLSQLFITISGEIHNLFYTVILIILF